MTARLPAACPPDCWHCRLVAEGSAPAIQLVSEVHRRFGGITTENLAALLAFTAHQLGGHDITAAEPLTLDRYVAWFFARYGADDPDGTYAEDYEDRARDEEVRPAVIVVLFVYTCLAGGNLDSFISERGDADAWYDIAEDLFTLDPRIAGGEAPVS
jgi:hypothetical protein